MKYLPRINNIFALFLHCKYSNKIVTINRYLKLSFHIEIHSFDECRAKVLEQEPGCLDYLLFQSYTDSTLFCLTEAWATKGAHNAHMQLEHTKKHISETRGIRDPAFKSKTGYTYWICPGANGK
jgi:quinol monooxygenase YgiN